MRNLKILQVYKDYYPPVTGGIEGHLNLLSTRLAALGHTVSALVSNSTPRLLHTQLEGVNITKTPQLGRFFSAPLNYSLPLWIKRMGQDADLLHFHIPNPTATIAYQLSRLTKPVVVTYHADITRQKRLNFFYISSLIRFLHSANKIIATSSNYVRSSKVLRDFRTKCVVIPLGIDGARFRPTPAMDKRVARIRSAYDKRIVLFLGKFRHYKGLNVLIEAMQRVDAVLLLLGSGPLDAELRNQVRRAGLERKIFFLGAMPDEDVNCYLHACDVFTLPATQRSEAFGLVQLEAMACGKPVVSTELGTGTSYVNCHGKTGIVVPPNDPYALAKAINQLVNSSEKRESYGRSGRKRVEEIFGAEQMINGTLDVYRAVMGNLS